MTRRAKRKAMDAAPRCGARTRSGGACKAPAVAGKKRCRMHGGAEGSGAPLGNKNAVKDGKFTREAIKERRAAAERFRIARWVLSKELRRKFPG